MTTPSSHRLYDELDPLYRAIWGTSLHHGLWKSPRDSPDKARQNLRELILATAPPRGTVADIGCGYGILARELIDRFDCQVMAGTDSGEQARRIAPHPQLTILTGNWLDQDLAPDSLDAALALESLSHFPSFDDFLRHTVPALKPGGSLIIADWFSETGQRPLLRHLAAAGRLPPWRSLASLSQAADRQQLSLAKSRDLSLAVAPTWSHLFRRALALPFRHPTLAPRLVAQSWRHPSLLWSFPLLRLAYETGDLGYHLLSFRK